MVGWRWRRICRRCCCRAVRDFHETFAAELVAGLDRVPARPADLDARCRCSRCRGRSSILWWRWCLVDRRRRLVWCRCCCRVVRDFYETLAAELVAGLDRVPACPADPGSCCRCNRDRSGILRRGGWRRLVGRCGSRVYRCRWRRRCLIERCWCRDRRGGCRGDIPAPCTTGPAELLIWCERCTAGAAAQPANQRSHRRSCSGRFFDK